jgi:hypothetical protein
MLATVMLRAVGVEAVPAAIRRRSDGVVPTEFPIPARMNDLLVRIKNGNGFHYFSPSSDLHVGKLPFDCSGVIAMPFDGVTEQPEAMPDSRARDNLTRRSANVTVSAEGDITVRSMSTHWGMSAERWRRALRGESEEDQKITVEETLQRHHPGAQLASVKITNLEDTAKVLSIQCQWEVPGYASVAGKRLILNPFLYDRVDASDWAPESREEAVDLRAASEVLDTMTYRLPPELEQVDLPQPAKFAAGPVGLYQTTIERKGNAVTVKRHLRLDMYRFDSKSYAGLKKWFTDIAGVDAKPLVVKLQ